MFHLTSPNYKFSCIEVFRKRSWNLPCMSSPLFCLCRVKP